jgi:hypothetical protein
MIRHQQGAKNLEEQKSQADWRGACITSRAAMY